MPDESRDIAQVNADHPTWEYPDLRSDSGALRIRFDPGFGLNVYIERWANVDLAQFGGKPFVDQSVGLSIGGWEALCEMVHEYEEWDNANRHRFIGPFGRTS